MSWIFDVGGTKFDIFRFEYAVVTRDPSYDFIMSSWLRNFLLIGGNNYNKYDEKNILSQRKWTKRQNTFGWTAFIAFG